MDTWFAKVGAGFDGFLSRVAEFLPNVIAAIAILVAAWLVGRALRFLAIRLLTALDLLFSRVFARGALSRLRLPKWSMRLIGGLVFWITLLIGLDFATRALDLSLASRWLDNVIEYVPTVIAVAVIVIAGFLASSVLREVSTTGARSAGMPQAKQVGIAVQAIALGIATTVGLDQLGIDVNLLIMIISVVLGAALGGLALAFALGARPYVANVLAARHVARLYRSGAKIRFDDHEGIVTSVGPTFVSVSTSSGVVAIPASLFFDRASLAIQSTDDN